MKTPDLRIRHHATLERLVLFDFRLTCRTGLHIGAGKGADLAGSDLPVMRDADGRPLIPGSSLRGVLRAGIESFCRSLGLDRIQGRSEASDLPPDLVKGWEGLNLTDRLFGAAADKPGGFSYGSRVQISDALCDAAVPVEVRDGVGISRDTRTAREGVKFDLEVVPAGTCFQGRARFKNPADHEVGLVAQALWMLDQGVLLLGGKSSRGLGWVQVEVSALREVDAAAILARTSPDEQSLGFRAVDEVLGRYLKGLQDLAQLAAAS